MIDLNGFKRINDSLGHEVGDLLLEQIGRQLRHAVRSPAMLARLGGDEFIIVADEISSAQKIPQIVDFCRQGIVEALEKPFRVTGKDLVVSASLGVAIYPDDADDEVALRRLADQRMYEEKRQTRTLAEIGA
jgi:diguanylate cyclase